MVKVPGTDALKTALEGASGGRRVAELVRFTRGAQSANYAGRWADGDSRFALKLVPFERAKQYARLVDHLEKVTPGVAVRESVPRVRFDVDGFHALVFVWCGGKPLGLEALAGTGGVEDLVADYRAFSATIQGVSELYPAYDYESWADEALDSPFAIALPRDFEDVDFSLLTKDARVIHGDFQSDNLRFAGGRLAGVLDLEEFRRGSPLEDFARYVCQGADRISWWSWARYRAVLAGVERLRRATDASPEAWRAAVYGQLLWKLHKTLGKGKAGFRQALNLKWRLRKYRDLAGFTGRMR